MLLKHFAQHASEVKSENGSTTAMNHDNKKLQVPDLYPISSFKSKQKHFNLNNGTNDTNIQLNNNASNSLQYLAVLASSGATSSNNSSAFIEKSKSNQEKLYSNSSNRKYKCSYCERTFGWSTDLKRHILIHTGEKPFKCLSCDAAFTRKFLLQKHQVKRHSDIVCSIVNSPIINGSIHIPPLKPINFNYKQKSRKQDKQNIKRKVLNTKNLYQSMYDYFEVSANLVCST